MEIDIIYVFDIYNGAFYNDSRMKERMVSHLTGRSIFIWMYR